MASEINVLKRSHEERFSSSMYQHLETRRKFRYLCEFVVMMPRLDFFNIGNEFDYATISRDISSTKDLPATELKITKDSPIHIFTSLLGIQLFSLIPAVTQFLLRTISEYFFKDFGFQYLESSIVSTSTSYSGSNPSTNLIS